MTTSVDISNRALSLIGIRNIISSTTQDSLEARVANLVYTPILAWCTGLANWNFTRKCVTLSILSFVSPPTGTWNAANPPPPWLNAWLLPADFVRARYITNTTGVNDTATAWLGQPQRFQIASTNEGTSAGNILLTNNSDAILVYNALVTDPTLWSTYFTEVMVQRLAVEMTMSLTGNLQLRQNLMEMFLQTLNFAIVANQNEGLVMDDTAPEWIVALGIQYPSRREDNRAVKVRPNDNER